MRASSPSVAASALALAARLRELAQQPAGAFGLTVVFAGFLATTWAVAHPYDPVAGIGLAPTAARP